MVATPSLVTQLCLLLLLSDDPQLGLRTSTQDIHIRRDIYPFIETIASQRGITGAGPSAYENHGLRGTECNTRKGTGRLADLEGAGFYWLARASPGS